LYTWKVEKNDKTNERRISVREEEEVPYLTTVSVANITTCIVLMVKKWGVRGGRRKLTKEYHRYRRKVALQGYLLHHKSHMDWP
jgi:hypothetical protein